MPAPTDQIIAATHAERTRLVGLLDDLRPEQWAAPSLCAGWEVREVLAHITMPFRVSTPGFVLGLLGARLSFNRYADRDARSAARKLTDVELVALLRENIRHPWRPPGGGELGALSHDVIHGLDITEPLGLPRPPVDRVALVLQDATPKSIKYFGVDLDGRRLVAVDADVEIGSGVELRLPVADILMVVSGRRTVADAAR